MDSNDEVYNSSTDWEKNIGTVSSRTSSRSPSTSRRSSQRDSLPPKTIVLGLWPGARQDQIEYYINGYRSLYPSAKVVVLRHSHVSRHHIDGALDRIASDYENLCLPISQDVFIHIFGDDAAVHVCKMLREYRARTDLPLGVGSIVLDSVPVVIAPSWRSLRAVPEHLLLFIYLTLLAIFWRLTSVLTLWFSEPYGDQVQRDLHDPTLLSADARKSYIFPERDVMWAWDRPTEEDEACGRREFDFKRKRVDQPDFWSGDQERYWLGIENAWEGR